VIHVEQTGNHPDAQPLPLTVALPPDQLGLLARAVADLLEQGRDEGFVDVNGAADFLCLARRAVYRLVERDRLPHHRAGLAAGCCSIGGSSGVGGALFASGRQRMPPAYMLTVRRRRALAMTLTEESAIAAAAIIGFSSIPNAG
jgi:hypothetical protein